MDITRELEEVELGELAGEVSPEAMQWLAIKFGFSHAEIQTEKERYRENLFGFKMEFLVSWKNRENALNGPEARKVTESSSSLSSIIWGGGRGVVQSKNEFWLGYDCCPTLLWIV